MFNVEINGSEVFAGDDAFKAWNAYRDMCATMTIGDEVILWLENRIEDISTMLFPAIPIEPVEDDEAFALTEASPMPMAEV